MHAVLHALSITGSMTWEITWALILGFALSAVVQAVVRKSTVVSLLGDAGLRTLAVAAGLGAASSSCSYAAVALARSLFREGANFTAAMAFEIASTNLVVELGVILALLMGWQFTAAEFVGGPIMIILLAALFRLFLRDRLLRQAREHAEQGLAGSMEATPRWTCPSSAKAPSSAGSSPVRASPAAPAAAPPPRSPRRHQPRIRHGMGGDTARPRPRPAHRRRHRCMGPGFVLAHLLLRRPPARRQTVGPIVGPLWPSPRLCAPSATCRWR